MNDAFILRTSKETESSLWGYSFFDTDENDQVFSIIDCPTTISRKIKRPLNTSKELNTYTVTHITRTEEEERIFLQDNSDATFEPEMQHANKKRKNSVIRYDIADSPPFLNHHMDVVSSQNAPTFFSSFVPNPMTPSTNTCFSPEPPPKVEKTAEQIKLELSDKREKSLNNALKIWHRSPSKNFSTLESLTKKYLNEANGYTTSIAKSGANRSINRYTDIHPYDHQMINDESKYLNGSPIHLAQLQYMGLDGNPIQPNPLEYIATDSPLPAAFDKYWEMIWNQDVHQIVNLTESLEARRIKSHEYWPKLNESFQFGDNLEVKMTAEEDIYPDPAFNSEQYKQNRMQHITKRTFELKVGNQTKTVIQYHYRHWPDMGAPESDQEVQCFKKLLHEVRKEQTGQPIATHCSAGVGRTGTFIASHYFEEQKSNGMTYPTPDVAAAAAGEVILKMRSQRGNMVQQKTPAHPPAQFDLIVKVMSNS